MRKSRFPLILILHFQRLRFQYIFSSPRSERCSKRCSRRASWPFCKLLHAVNQFTIREIYFTELLRSTNIYLRSEGFLGLGLDVIYVCKNATKAKISAGENKGISRYLERKHRIISAPDGAGTTRFHKEHFENETIL